MKIGFIGNFEAEHSTENDRAWAFNRLGHQVIAFQENGVTSDMVMARLKELDLLVYSHTHGWELVGIEDIFANCRDLGIPVISVHLDRWAWLEREKDVGTEATWKVDHMFMADMSPEAVELYEKHGLHNFSYLKPGVDARGAYMAAPDPVRFPHEIVFVGSKGYHPEYPFRPQLVEFLHKTYGKRFGHYGGDGKEVVRGHALNTLYATAKIVVGDSIFGGRPQYWSDRVTETMGRGGFLIHPLVTDLPKEIQAPYKAEDLMSLHQTINRWLAYEQDRKNIQKKAFEHVKKHETYTNRAQKIISFVKENL